MQCFALTCFRWTALDSRLYSHGCRYHQCCSGFPLWCCERHILVRKISESVATVFSWAGTALLNWFAVYRSHCYTVSAPLLACWNLWLISGTFSLLSVCLDVCRQTFFKSLPLPHFFVWFSQNLASVCRYAKKCGTDFKILILKFLAIFFFKF